MRPRPPTPSAFRAGVFTLALAVVLLGTGCGGVAAPPPAPTATATTSPPAPSPTPALPVRPPQTPASARCAEGRLTVGDLVAVDAEWAAGVAAAAERARAWRSDARLVRLRVACQPLEPAFRWQGTYYSETAQSFFASDTGQTEPAEVDPASVPTLPLDRISFRELHLSLARAGHADEAELNAASGVTVRLNDPADPFGPPGTPPDVVYHVAVDDQGEVRDLFVSAANWTIYSYRDQG
jgi:hypothetical protein